MLNAILLKVASIMQVTMLSAVGRGGLGSALLSFFVVAGALSLVIGINYKVGGLVFAPLMEIHRRALGATKTVALLAAAGAAVAMGGGGALTAGLGLAGTGGPSPAGSGGALAMGPSEGGSAAPLGAAARAGGGGGSPAAAATALSALAGMSGNPIVRGALSAAAQGFRRADAGNGSRPAGLPALAGSSSPGGVFSVSMRDAAQSVLGEHAAPGEVGRLAASPDFQRAMRRARRHASGLERAGIPFQEQVRGAGFPTPRRGICPASAFRWPTVICDRRSRASARMEMGSPRPQARDSVPPRRQEDRYQRWPRGWTRLGKAAFPGRKVRCGIFGGRAGGPSTLIRRTPNSRATRKPFSRPDATCRPPASQGQSGDARTGGSGWPAEAPAAEPAPAEHMSRIQEQILSGAFREHQEPLARIFNSWRRGRG